MGWFNRAMAEVRHIYALRKHNLNVDLHIHCLANMQTGADADAIHQTSYMRSICGSAVLKGLDIIGIVSKNSFEPGLICRQIITERDYDLYVLAGVEITTGEKIHTVVYNTRTIPRDGETIESVCQRAHQEGGTVMVIQPSKANMKKLNAMAGQPTAPDFIEMFNDMSKGGYVHTFIDVEAAPEFHLVVNSAARSPRDLDRSVMMTRIPRSVLVGKGIISEEYGVDYTPPYLENVTPIG